MAVAGPASPSFRWGIQLWCCIRLGMPDEVRADALPSPQPPHEEAATLSAHAKTPTPGTGEPPTWGS